MANATLQELRDIFYWILRETQDPQWWTSAYPLVLADLFLNSAEQSILWGRIINPITKEEARAGQLPFLNKEIYYANVKPTSLSADAVAGWTTLTVSTTSSFPTSGTLFMQWNIIPYTGLTATQFTGCTGILFNFKSGTQLSLAYALPADYSSVINVVYNNRFQLPPKVYDDTFEDLNRFKGNNYQRNRTQSLYESPMRIKPFYTIKDSKYVIVWNIQDTNATIRVRYQKVQDTMVNSTDQCTIDNATYAKACIPYMAVGEMLYNRWEEARASSILSFGISKVKEMYTWYDTTDFENISGTQYKLGKGNLNI